MTLFSPYQFPAINGLVKNLKIEIFDKDPIENILSGKCFCSALNIKINPNPFKV